MDEIIELAEEQFNKISDIKFSELKNTISDKKFSELKNAISKYKGNDGIYKIPKNNSEITKLVNESYEKYINSFSYGDILTDDEVNIFKIFIHLGVDINIKTFYGETLLSFLARYCAHNYSGSCYMSDQDINNMKLIKDLIKNGADTKKENLSVRAPLYEIISQNNYMLTGSLIEEGYMDIGYGFGQKLIHYLAINYNKGDNESLIKFFIKESAKRNVNYINTKDNSGKTPLHYAIENNNTKLTELLIKNGADINTKDNSGKTPLHYAIENNNTKLTELLIKNGADINTKDNSGKTPLHYAIENNNTELTELLIKNGADLNKKDNFYYSNKKIKNTVRQQFLLCEKSNILLHNAIINRNEKLIKNLLINGKRLDEKDKVGNNTVINSVISHFKQKKEKSNFDNIMIVLNNVKISIQKKYYNTNKIRFFMRKKIKKQIESINKILDNLAILQQQNIQKI